MIVYGAVTVKDVENFLLDAGKSLQTFRYYSRRNIAESMSRHIVTLIGYDYKDAPIAYGHLDKAGEQVWLAICVIEDAIGNGHGRRMMQSLVRQADERGIEELRLSVDAGNVRARKMYESFGFEIFQQGDPILMKRSRAMADTLGSLVDKLCTVGQKMFSNQDLLYDIRRMTFEEYKVKFFETEDGARRLWETLKKACDLNVQRNALINEVDEKVLEIAKAAAAGKDLDNGSFLQRAHKTY